MGCFFYFFPSNWEVGWVGRDPNWKIPIRSFFVFVWSLPSFINFCWNWFRLNKICCIHNHICCTRHSKCVYDCILGNMLLYTTDVLDWNGGTITPKPLHKPSHYLQIHSSAYARLCSFSQHRLIWLCLGARYNRQRARNEPRWRSACPRLGVFF